MLRHFYNLLCISRVILRVLADINLEATYLFCLRNTISNALNVRLCLNFIPFQVTFRTLYVQWCLELNCNLSDVQVTALIVQTRAVFPRTAGY